MTKHLDLLEINSKQYPISYVKKKRVKYLRLSLTRENDIRVVIPSFCSLKEAYLFVEEKKEWLEKKIEHNFQQYQMLPKRTGDEKEPYLYLGRDYLLKYSSENSFFLDNNFFYIPYFYKERSHQDMMKAIRGWYLDRAKDIILDRVHLYSHKMNLFPKNVRIKSLKSRWGSCSSLKNLNFTWNLVMADLSVIDYVVVHELAHLKHMNHSKSFWNVVETHYPTYKVQRGWLKDNGHLLNLHLHGVC